MIRVKDPDPELEPCFQRKPPKLILFMNVAFAAGFRSETHGPEFNRYGTGTYST